MKKIKKRKATLKHDVRDAYRDIYISKGETVDAWPSEKHPGFWHVPYGFEVPRDWLIIRRK